MLAETFGDVPKLLSLIIMLSYICGMQPSTGGALAADLALDSVCSKMYYIIPYLYVPAPYSTHSHLSFAYPQGKNLGALSIGCGEHSHIKLHIQYYTIIYITYICI